MGTRTITVTDQNIQDAINLKIDMYRFEGPLGYALLDATGDYYATERRDLTPRLFASVIMPNECDDILLPEEARAFQEDWDSRFAAYWRTMDKSAFDGVKPISFAVSAKHLG